MFDKEPNENQIKVEIERLTYRNTENGYSVIRVRDVEALNSFQVVGFFEMVHPGQRFILNGDWTVHSQFGRQFKVKRAAETMPNSKEGMVRYLSSGLFAGMGEKTAEKIVNHFGSDVLNILENQPEKILKVPKIAKKNAASILESWRTLQGSRHVLMFLSCHGFTPRMSQKIFGKYGADTIKILTKNPYMLIRDINGIGFTIADRFAQSVGLSKDDPQRIEQGLLYVFSQAEERSGHAFLYQDQIFSDLASTLGLEPEDAAKKASPILEYLSKSGALVAEKTTDETRQYFSMDLFLAEKNIASVVKNLMQATLSERRTLSEAKEILLEQWLEEFCETAPLSEQQKDAVKLAARSKIFVLTGGPGVGKTTTANAIIKYFKSQGLSLALCAPTGRAAQRLKEASQTPAKTIHRLLEWSGPQRGFMRDEHNLLQEQVIIVDEVSMLDLRLGESLFRAVPPSSQLVLIGDVDQLPSIGPGTVLKDCIESGLIPLVKLTEVFRQAASSNIIRHAHEINRGEMPEFQDGASSDCRFIHAKTPEEICSAVGGLLTESLVKSGYDPVKHVQVLSPMNRGDLGCQVLNLYLQNLLNPLREGEVTYQRGQVAFRPRDKVIQTSNNYDLKVFNGDIGFVDFTKVDGFAVVVNFEGRQISYDSEQAQELGLAYAITIHKSQGSEFPSVIMPMSMQHYIMLQRNLIYTGLTRAKGLAVFIGETRALRKAISTQTSKNRQTKLSQRIREIL